MIITDNNHRDNEREHGGLENEVQQNHGMDQYAREKKTDGQQEKKAMNPVDNGGVKSTELEPRLEKQWLAVRDEYLANYPDLRDEDTEYEKGSFDAFIDRLAQRQQRHTNEVQQEIMNWYSNDGDKD